MAPGIFTRTSGHESRPPARWTPGRKSGRWAPRATPPGPTSTFERHATTTGGWSCAVVRDPQPSIDWEGEEMTEDEWGRMETLIGKVWAEQMTVTQPGTGQDTTKSRQQVLRELWQKVTKAT
jgi:hypothetical protein